MKFNGYRWATLDVIVDNYEAARKGNTRMQAFIACQYKAAIGLDKAAYLDWDDVTIQSTGPLEPPTPEIKKHNRNRATVPQIAHIPEMYGCTCNHDNCVPCDLGEHEHCGYNCRCGEVVQ